MRNYAKICSITDCGRLSNSHTYCARHLWRFRKYGDPQAGGKIQNRTIKFCSVDGCERQHVTNGYCRAHWQRVLRTGEHGSAAIKEQSVGTIDKNGYRHIVVPEGTPGAVRRGAGNCWMILEHRHVMNQILGRPLEKNEEVHHKNAIRADNRPENLELWARSQPPGSRVKDLLSWADEIYAKYSHLREEDIV